MGWGYDYKPYVPVAKRRAQAAKEVAKRLKNGQKVSPVVIEGRLIAATFWGKAWCTNLESYSDFENRLPRGRTYVRNGSVVDLKIEKGRINALVSGSEIYTVRIEITALSQKSWKAVKAVCAGQIGSLVELLQGKLSNAVMKAVTDRTEGLFPKPKEIKMQCSCPDYAGMCKHLAAVMYGIGNRLDTSPELLFKLRGVDHLELIEQAIPETPTQTKLSAPTLETDELGAIFGIELGDTPVVQPPSPKPKSTSKKASKVKTPPTAAATAPAPVKQARPKKSVTVKQSDAKKTVRAKQVDPKKSVTAKQAAEKKTVKAKQPDQKKTTTVKQAAAKKTVKAKQADPKKSATVKSPTGGATKKTATASGKKR